MCRCSISGTLSTGCSRKRRQRQCSKPGCWNGVPKLVLFVPVTSTMRSDERKVGNLDLEEPDTSPNFGGH